MKRFVTFAALVWAFAGGLACAIDPPITLQNWERTYANGYMKSPTATVKAHVYHNTETYALVASSFMTYPQDGRWEALFDTTLPTGVPLRLVVWYLDGESAYITSWDKTFPP